MSNAAYAKEEYINACASIPLNEEPSADEYNQFIDACIEEIKAAVVRLDRGETFTLTIKRDDVQDPDEETEVHQSKRFQDFFTRSE